MTVYSQNNQAKGFTIVEVMVIVVVVAILAAITVVSYSAVTENAKKKTAETDAQGTAVYLNKYKSENGGYPAALEEATSLPKSEAIFDYQYSAADDTYCLTASIKQIAVHIKSGSTRTYEGSCPVGE